MPFQSAPDRLAERAAFFGESVKSHLREAKFIRRQGPADISDMP
jgi:hypothetical protein